MARHYACQKQTKQYNDPTIPVQREVMSAMTPQNITCSKLTKHSNDPTIPVQNELNSLMTLHYLSKTN
jgi:hypothetical protein